ncbi:MAG: PAAR domain-containing protein [Acidiphilium sp.]
MAAEKPAARISDLHVCPSSSGPVPHVGGPVLSGSPNVLIGGLSAARVSDSVNCVGPPDQIMMGSPSVLINGLMAARQGDPTAHGGMIVAGCPTVLIGVGAAGATPPPELGAGATSSAQSDAMREAAHRHLPFAAICKLP